MKRFNLLIAVASLVLAMSVQMAEARADGPPLLALPRPGLLGSYIFQPLPSGLFTWSATDAAPGLTQATQTSDAAPPNMVITPGAPLASASTNKTPGSLILNEPIPVAGGNEAPFTIQRGGVAQFWFQGLNTAPTAGGALYMNVAPGTNNYTLYGSSTNTVLNVPSSGTLFLDVNNTAVVTATAAAITLSQPVTANSTLAATGAITHPSPQTIACGTGGTQTVAASPTSGFIVTSGTLASNCTIDFSTNATSGDFTLDMGGVTLGTSFGVIFKNGTTSSPTFTSGSVITTGDTLAKVWTHGANTLAVQY